MCKKMFFLVKKLSFWLFFKWKCTVQQFSRILITFCDKKLCFGLIFVVYSPYGTFSFFETMQNSLLKHLMVYIMSTLDDSQVWKSIEVTFQVTGGQVDLKLCFAPRLCTPGVCSFYLIYMKCVCELFSIMRSAEVILIYFEVIEVLQEVKRSINWLSTLLEILVSLAFE